MVWNLPSNEMKEKFNYYIWFIELLYYKYYLFKFYIDVNIPFLKIIEICICENKFIKIG